VSSHGADFAGSGWAFPVRPGPDGTILVTADGDDAIRSSIWMILSTSPGERVMRPDFGCGIADHVFDVNDAGTAGAISRTVQDALAEWEPRIDVLDVDTRPDHADPHRLLIEIDYEVRATNSRLNLVYPFYLE
jgi:phage baseplate assembly protein W